MSHMCSPVGPSPMGETWLHFALGHNQRQMSQNKILKLYCPIRSSVILHVLDKVTAFDHLLAGKEAVNQMCQSM